MATEEVLLRREARLPAWMARWLKDGPVTDGIPILCILAWYFYSTTVPEFVVPNPLKALKVTLDLFWHPDLMHHTYISLARVIGSVVLSVVIGSIVVLVGRYVPLTRRLVANRIIPLLNAFPSLGWAMLAVIWFGVSNPSVLFVEVAILLPFCMINMWEGFKTLDEEILEMARSFTHQRVKILARVILPLLFPYIFAATRISYGVGWKVALIAELFGARTGLGYLLNLARQNFDTPLLFGTIISLVVMVGIMERLVFDPIEARVQRHQAVQAPSVQ